METNKDKITLEKYYVIMVEKGLYRATLEVIKQVLPSLSCELDYEITSFENDTKYMVVELCDYSRLLSIPSPTLEEIFQKLPILFLREENSSYILTRKSAETRAKIALENVFSDTTRDEELIYNMFTLNERLQCMLDAVDSFFDSASNLKIGEWHLNEKAKCLFSEVIDWDVTDVSKNETHTIDPTLDIEKTKYTLCLLG